jgi:enoyl-CoA hydratase/carnithine racemase
MSDFLRYDAIDGVAILTLDAPERRNTLGSEHEYGAIEAAVARASKDKSVRAIVLTGSGPAFCAGGDIKAMFGRSNDPSIEALDDRYAYKEGIHRIPLSLFNCEVPTIAAVNGAAIGAGLDLACMCDIRIAAEGARFAESFVTLGIIPGDGGAFLLQRIVGYAKAAELTFTGAIIDAEEALSIGLVSRVVAQADLMPTAIDLATRIAANPGHALRMAKRLLREAQTARLESVLELSAAFQALAHDHLDHRTRIAGAVSRLSRTAGLKDKTQL